MNTLFDIGTTAHRRPVTAHQLINQDSGDVEYYTPAWVTEAASMVMGGIDLDPASCEVANKTVGAARYFTVADNGLMMPWYGRVWMNHPFGKAHNRQWINRLVAEFIAGHISQACCICFASTSEAWFQPLFNYAQCYLSPRLNYISQGNVKKGVSKGSVVTYLGPHVDRFAAVFGQHGRVMVPHATNSAAGRVA